MHLKVEGGNAAQRRQRHQPIVDEGHMPPPIQAESTAQAIVTLSLEEVEQCNDALVDSSHSKQERHTICSHTNQPSTLQKAFTALRCAPPCSISCPNYLRATYERASSPLGHERRRCRASHKLMVHLQRTADHDSDGGQHTGIKGQGRIKIRVWAPTGGR